MDETTAKALLQQIKQADSPGDPGMVAATAATQLENALAQDVRNNAYRELAKTLAIGAGLGGAVRGAIGFRDLLRSRKKAKTPRVVDMPVAYPADKRAAHADKVAVVTSKYGIPEYTAGMLLGVPLATYGGWTAIDKLLENQRAKQTEEELDAAKQKYQAALMGTYKKAIDTRLDQLFAHYEKQASVKDLLLNPLNWLANAPSEYFPNATGAAKGVGAAYALATAPLGYHIVNKAMKKRNKESLLREAMQERARRQALTQPPEIYAIPTPTQEDSAE